MTTTWWKARTDSSFAANVSPTSVLATTTPTTETPISPATRATALLIAEAMPASRLVGVGEHRRRERRDGHRQTEREHEHRRQHVREVGRVEAGPQQKQDAGGGDQRPGAHEQPRPVAVGERAEAAREGEHDQRHRQRRQAALERAVAGDLLQEDDEEEEQDREPGVHRERLDVADGEVAAREQLEPRASAAPRGARRRGTPANDDDAPTQRHEDRRARPAVARLLDQREHDPAEAERAEGRARGRRRARVERTRASVAPRRGSARASTRTSGTLSAKIQRHETWSTIQPPASGPTMAAIPPQAVHDPIAGPRSLGRERGDDDRERARRQQRSRRSLQRARGDQRLDRRGQRRTRARARRTPPRRSRTRAAAP